jgi:hypothetical protein
MPHAFDSPDAVENRTVHLRGQDAAPGARPAVQGRRATPRDRRHHRIAAVITAVERNAVDATVLESQPARAEPRPQVSVLQALLPCRDFEEVRSNPAGDAQLRTTGSRQGGVGGADNWGSVE